MKRIPLILVFPFLIACSSSNNGFEVPLPPPHTEDVTKPEDNQKPEEPRTGNEEEENQIPADAILVTNPYMDKYLEEVHYPENDWSYTLLFNYPGGGPGEADIPPAVTLTWPAGASGALALHLVEGDDQWTRDYTLKEGTTSLDVSNLVPNQRYFYTVNTSDGKEFARDTFYTKGHLHQIYFTQQVRNGRDLGGWKTFDGKTVKYRKLYRSGKPSNGKIDAAGVEEARAQGIKAQLVLRETDEWEQKNHPLGADVDVFGPGFTDGYSTMMKETEKVKQCFDFVLKSLKADKPVLFHCSIGSDRTGTMSILFLGLLGVPEPDVCKEYELSYFAPEDWSMTNGKCTRIRTYSSRYLNVIPYIRTFANNDCSNGGFRQQVENYFISIGVTKSDINDFRAIMLK